MKKVLLVPVWIAAWFLLMPTQYKTVTFAKSEKGKRYVLAREIPKRLNVTIGDSVITIGRARYSYSEFGMVKFSDSLYGYQCRTVSSGEKCAISIGKTYGESFHYRIIIMWPDSMYEYKAN